MPQLDLYHEVVKHALEKDGWTITDDPLVLKIGIRRLYADLGAERLLNAEKGLRKIAVEIKSLIGQSIIRDLEQAIGQFVLYRKILAQQEQERTLYLAVSSLAYENIFAEEIGQLLMQDRDFHLLVFDENNEEISQWIPD